MSRFATLECRKPNAEAAFGDAQIGNRIARGFVELVLGSINAKASRAGTVASINALPERFASAKVKQNDDHREIAAAPVRDILGVHQMFEMIPIVGCVRSIIRRFDLDSDKTVTDST